MVYDGNAKYSELGEHKMNMCVQSAAMKNKVVDVCWFKRIQ